MLVVGGVGALLIWLAAALGSSIAIGGAITLLIIAIAVIAVIFSALNAIYKAAVYEYAADGIAASAFGQDALSNAFVAKK
jgi:hypothetical protein